MLLQVSKLSKHARLPSRGSALAAGLDLYAAHETVVPAKGKGLVKTDLAIKCPPETYGRIAPRSSLAWKSHVDVGAGVVDADYRGNVGVVLFNHGDNDLVVAAGDRVAQLILERIVTAQVEEVDSLDETQRGAGGFGSTGLNDDGKGSTVSKRSAAPPRDESSSNSKRVKIDIEEVTTNDEIVDLMLQGLASDPNMSKKELNDLRRRVLGAENGVLEIGRVHLKVRDDAELVKNLRALSRDPVEVSEL